MDDRSVLPSKVASPFLRVIPDNEILLPVCLALGKSKLLDRQGQ